MTPGDGGRRNAARFRRDRNRNYGATPAASPFSPPVGATWIGARWPTDSKSYHGVRSEKSAHRKRRSVAWSPQCIYANQIIGLRLYLSYSV